MTTSMLPGSRPPIYRDTRFTGILVQVLFVVGVVALGWFLYDNLVTNLSATGNAAGSALSWNFPGQTAGFAIAEGPTFRPEESYWRAYLVGIANTLRVSAAGIVFATLLGALAGIARVSNNWLLRKLALVYVETICSTPLLVQLLFWYLGVIVALPDISEAAAIPYLRYLSNRGLYVLWPYITATGQPGWWLLGALIAGASAAWLHRRWLTRQGLLGAGVFLLLAVIGFFVSLYTGSLPDNVVYELRRGDRGVLFADQNASGAYEPDVDKALARVPVTLFSQGGQELGRAYTDGNGEFRFYDLPEEGASLTWEAPPPVVVSEPVRQGFNFRGGLAMTPEFAGLLLGLVIYTGACIAEIVRAGINAVPRDQWEASRALGLTTPTTLRMIVIPQALRVIIPPLTSQYLNLVENSSLAIAIGYPDLFYVARIIVNQSGAEVQMILVVMGTYLSISLLTSLFMNWYKKRVAIVER